MEEKEQSNNSKKWNSRILKVVIVFVIIIAAVVSGILWRILATYNNFEVRNGHDRTDSEHTEYRDFKGNLLAYSRDGMFYTDYSGNLIWNESYEMSSPQVEITQGYLLVYDKNGTQIRIMSPAGNAGSITTTLPVTAADISGSGTIAVLMQDNAVAYLHVYDVSGNLLASGEIHMNKGGYPIDIAISSDAKRLMVTMLDLTSGSVQSTINFYNFGDAGIDQTNNLMGTFTYGNMVIPEVDYVKDDCAIAIGDSEIVVFGTSEVPKPEAEIYLSEEIKSIYHDNRYIGIITATTDGAANNLTVYNLRGKALFTKTFEEEYNNCYFLSDGESVITDGQILSIYNRFGVQKFTYDFGDGIYQIIPWEGNRNYVLIRKDRVERIRLTKE
ncbi:MAG: DUF5711 family protein [Lachnospiraceae bacterium]|nr:DUF5711 family protein [Lachnospiraceae bacterium]